jgi:hypothetical protein
MPTEALKWFLSIRTKDIDLNPKDAVGWTPLHVAIVEGNLEAADILIRTDGTAHRYLTSCLSDFFSLSITLASTRN